MSCIVSFVRFSQSCKFSKLFSRQLRLCLILARLFRSSISDPNSCYVSVDIILISCSNRFPVIFQSWYWSCCLFVDVISLTRDVSSLASVKFDYFNYFMQHEIHCSAYMSVFWFAFGHIFRMIEQIIRVYC